MKAAVFRNTCHGREKIACVKSGAKRQLLLVLKEGEVTAGVSGADKKLEGSYGEGISWRLVGMYSGPWTKLQAGGV